MKNLLLLIILCMIGMMPAYAQTAYYQFSQSTGVLASQPGTGVTTLVAAASADGVSAVSTIGFNLNYAGVTYTQFSASANGLLRLGSTAVTTESVNNMTSATNIPKIMGFWDDMATGTSASGGGVRTWLSGSSPSRKRVIDFKLASDDLTTSAYDFQFQIWIHETSGMIEVVYGAGATAGKTASIGLGGAVATDFLSVTPGGPATTNNASANNAVTANPGSGVKYTFSPPAPLTGIKTVGTGMDYPTLKDAVTVLNWVGVGSGGVTFNISGGHTETVAAGSTVPNPDVPAGLFITASGTAANPIVIKWNGAGAKPIFKAGAGIGNFDFVIGIGGGDYITLDGLNIQEDNTNNTTNAKRAEIGIGLFKKQYNTTLGNDGCNAVTVKNCMVTLTRDPNAIGNYSYCQDNYFSAGIKASAFTSTHQGATNFFEGGNPNGGIKSQNDVHRNCVIIGNTIDNCTFGITFADRWAESGGNVFAGAGNIIGQSGAGNTITNWGLKAGSSITYGISESDMGRVVAGIAMGAQKDYTIEYNTVMTCGTNLGSNNVGPVSYCGILAGTGHDGNSWPQHASGFFAKINHNTVSGIDLTSGTNVSKAAYGISFAQFADHVTNTNLSSRPATGNVEITFNEINNLKVNRGDCHGISCKYYYEYWRRAVTTDDRTGGFQSSANVTINNNTIKALTKRTGNSNDAYYDGTFSAIYWMHGQNNLYIENNTIGGAGADGLVRGSATHAFLARNLAGSRMIWANAHFPRGARSLVQVKNNTITNVDQIGNPTMPVADNWSVGFSGIFVDNGGLINNIEGNTITGCDIGSGARNSGYEEALAFIFVNGKPRAGLATVNVSGNNLLNNSRTTYKYCYTNHGAPSFTAGIYSKYNASGQVKNIYNNVIDGLTGVAINSTNSHAYWARIEGIKVLSAGNRNTTLVNIYGNSIKNLGGDTYSYNWTPSSNSYNNYYLAFNTIGINATRYHRLRIYQNSVCNLSTTSTGYPTDQNFAQGVVGIIYGSDQGEVAPFTSLVDPKMAVYDNFVGQLSAPVIRSRLAVVGLFQWGPNGERVTAHNTVVLGSPTGAALGRLSSTTTGAFGVTGFLNVDYYLNNKTAEATWANNIVSINADCKGTGMGTAWRHQALSGIKKMWPSISTYSTGNVYFVNDDANNYIYGQGLSFGVTGGVRNCYGYGSSVTTNATYNMVNDNVAPKNLNDICGKYKSFMAGREKGSFLDLDPGNVMQALPFTNTGGCEAEIKISNGANSYVASAKRMLAPFNIATDFYNTARGATTVTAGAHENNANISGQIVNLINFEYTPICDGVCTGSKSLTATITPPDGKSIATAMGKTPRLYFRRIQNSSAISAAQSDNNVMVSTANNNATGTEGWRWVEASSVTGNDYTFIVNEALLKNTIVTTPTYTIEYFLIAETSDGTICNWSSGDLSANCPATVDLISIAGAATVPIDDDGDTAIDLNSVDDRYSVYAGASLTKKIQLINDGLAAKTANMAVAFPVCTGDEIRLNGQYSVTTTGQLFNPGCISYKMEVADNAAFTLGLQSFIQSDSAFTYTMAAAGTKYFRIWLNCEGTNVLNTNTTYVFVTASDMPVNNTTVVPLNSCVGVSQNITVSSSTPTVAKYYWVVNKHGKVYANAPTSTTSTAQVRAVNPADTSESGTWHTYVTLSAGATLTDQGIKAADYYDGSAYAVNGGDVDTTKGVAFHTNSFVKLNAISVLDDPNDGLGSAGFNIKLFSKTGVLLYSTAAQSTTDGQLKQIALTNWYIPPGDYMIVMGASTAGTEPTGGLSIVDASLPVGIANTSTSGLDILGGVSDFDFEGIDNSVSNYFFDWDVTILCTSNDVPFEYIVNPASCCALPAPSVAAIANGTAGYNLERSKCANVTGTWIYYFDPADPSKLLCAVEPNGNSWNPSVVNLYNTGAASDTAHLISDGLGSAAELMPYVLQLENADSLNVNGGIKIRFFYPTAQKAIIDAYGSTSWFAYGADKQGILDVLTANGLSGKTSLVPSASGTENGISYVEFHNVTFVGHSFGYLGTSCLAVGQVAVSDNSCTADDAVIKNGDNASLTASGGTNYLWDDASTAATRTVNPLVNTSYTVTITDENGCKDTVTTSITVVSAPVGSIVEADNSCNVNDGKILSGASATLTASGGSTYVWDDASTSVMRGVSPLATTTYTVTITDTNGCADTVSSTVTIVNLPVVSVAETDNSCAPNDAKVTSAAPAILTASGGVMYLWDNSSTAAARTVNPTSTTTYMVTATDANGCTGTGSSTVTVVTGPTANITTNDNSCTADDNKVLSGAAATLTASGGGTYFWDNASTAAMRVVNPSATTTYSVTVTDANGCMASNSNTVIVIAAPTANITETDNSCTPNDSKVLSGGAATLTASGGSTYLWDNTSTTAIRNVNPVATTTYSVTVTDANGCTASSSKTITIVNIPTVIISASDNSCSANDSKVLSGDAVTLTATGGSTYLWDNATTAASRTANPTSTGTYYVTVTDANGCTVTEGKTISVVSAPTAVITETDNSCASNDGKILSGSSAMLTASGGVFYLWDNASSSPSRNVSPTSTSTYTVTVTDLNGCTASTNTTVTIVTAPTGSISSTDNSCVANDEIVGTGGSATLTASGGSTYLWDNSSTAAVRVVSPVATTTFTVTVIDANGCTATANKTITVIAFCGVSVAAKVFLGSSYDDGTMLMTDNLRAANLLPLNQPYGGVEYPDFAYTGTEATTTPVLSVAGSNAVVDWVLVEIRDSLNPVNILARKAALVQRDGDIVDVDGVSPLLFTSIGTGNYHVAVRHRNHLGVMTGVAIALSSSGSSVDFTSSSTANYQLSGVAGSPHAQRTWGSGKRTLWAGNAGVASNTEDEIIYQGSNADIDEIYFKVLLDMNNMMFLPNHIVSNVYARTDVNLDGTVVFQGANSDPEVLFFTILLYPFNSLSLPNYTLFEQIPR